MNGKQRGGVRSVCEARSDDANIDAECIPLFHSFTRVFPLFSFTQASDNSYWRRYEKQVAQSNSNRCNDFYFRSALLQRYYWQSFAFLSAVNAAFSFAHLLCKLYCSLILCE